MSGRIVAIHVAPGQGAPVEGRDWIYAVAGRGLEGDRYFDDEGTFRERDGSDLTLIEREAIDAVEREYGIALEPGVHRRNITTRGIALNHLVGERFRVGSALCEGVELCEPCSYLERHLQTQGVREALVHRGGLRARVLEGGRIEPGEAVTGPDSE
ncbi:MOSC domain-containing protein [Natronorarus salvus]|uniref:MOSC domain-containing protein n=1 Tax=Natronorarus salvus TaxID=3117733 RepID=UPI002F2687AC